jgi:DNA polymerase-4
MARVIFHIDINAFFASVEQVVSPSLQGRPVAVVGSEVRTVLLSPSYEARAFGVKTGMRVPEARLLCPDLVFVPARNDRYTDACERLLALYREATPLVEVFSIDEAFLDVTASLPLFGGALTLARRIKQRMRERLGLRCSIGIAPNKLLAKLGSDLKKPDGLVVLDRETADEVLDRLPVEEICGIGPRFKIALEALGIRTCGELGRAPVRLLKARFGVAGERLKLMGQGVDESPVVPQEEEPEAKSVGHSMTLPRDLARKEEVEEVLLHLSEMVGRRLRRAPAWGLTTVLTLRYSDFETFSRQHRARSLTHDSLEIYARAREILQGIALRKPVRLVGVSVTDLERGVGQIPLYEMERRRRRAVEAADTVNDRYGEFTVTWATLLTRFRHRGVISPAWRPGGSRRVEFIPYDGREFR